MGLENWNYPLIHYEIDYHWGDDVNGRNWVTVDNNYEHKSLDEAKGKLKYVREIYRTCPMIQGTGDLRIRRVNNSIEYVVSGKYEPLDF